MEKKPVVDSQETEFEKQRGRLVQKIREMGDLLSCLEDRLDNGLTPKQQNVAPPKPLDEERTDSRMVSGMKDTQFAVESQIIIIEDMLHRLEI